MPLAVPPRPLAVLFGGVLMAALDIAIVGPALPAIGAAFAVDARALSWVFTSFVLFYLIGAPLIGKLADRAGRRRVFGVCLALFAAGSLIVAAAPAFGVLLAGRAVQALGAGGIFPVASALIADVVPPERRGRVLGLMGATFGVAFLLGPLLGALLLRFGWPWLFLINLPVAAALIAAGSRVLPGQAIRPGAELDAAGAAVLAALLAALVWAVNGVDGAAPLANLLSPRVWPFGLLALLALPLFWSIEKRARDPVLPPALLGSGPLRAVAVVALAAGLVEAAMVFLPDIAVRAFGAAPADASLMLLPLVGTLLVGAPLAGYWLDLQGPRNVVHAGLALTTAGLVLFGSMPLSTLTFYAAGAAVGLGLSGLLGAPLRFIVLREAGVERRGAGQGLLTLFLSTGQLVGGALIGGIAGSSASTLDGYRAAMLWVAGACAAALAVSAVLGAAPDREAD